MSSKKQTAVEWLVEKLTEQQFVTQAQIEQAKAMEKEQIIDAYEEGESGEWDPFDFNSGKKYYTSTYV